MVHSILSYITASQEIQLLLQLRCAENVPAPGRHRAECQVEGDGEQEAEDTSGAPLSKPGEQSNLHFCFKTFSFSYKRKMPFSLPLLLRRKRGPRGAAVGTCPKVLASGTPRLLLISLLIHPFHLDAVCPAGTVELEALTRQSLIFLWLGRGLHAPG